ncbi:MAG: helix-turn-helix domain-containing protein [Jatrophihabitantaceae bacterium]
MQSNVRARQPTEPCHVHDSSREHADTEWDELSVRPVVELLARRWVLAIVDQLWERPMRRSQLYKGLDGISDKILTETLRELMAAGYVSRHVQAATPPRVVYRLSRRGRSLGRLLDSISAWTRQADPSEVAGTQRRNDSAGSIDEARSEG